MCIRDSSHPGWGGAGRCGIPSHYPEWWAVWNWGIVHFWTSLLNIFGLQWTTGNWNCRKQNLGSVGNYCTLMLTIAKHRKEWKAPNLLYKVKTNLIKADTDKIKSKIIDSLMSPDSRYLNKTLPSRIQSWIQKHRPGLLPWGQGWCSIRLCSNTSYCITSLKEEKHRLYHEVLQTSLVKESSHS